MCKILVQNFIIKDILKKKNDVHWISVRTIVEKNTALLCILDSFGIAVPVFSY